MLQGQLKLHFLCDALRDALSAPRLDSPSLVTHSALHKWAVLAVGSHLLASSSAPETRETLGAGGCGLCL